MVKSILVLILFLSTLYSKECYRTKVEKVCYYKYFNKHNIYKAKADEDYYMDKHHNIYSFSDIIAVRFKSIGGIFEILNSYDVEFYDKIKKDIYLFKVKDKSELFSTVSKLNELTAVMRAYPKKTKKYTKSYMEAVAAAKKARLEEVLRKTQRSLKQKNVRSLRDQINQQKQNPNAKPIVDING